MFARSGKFLVVLALVLTTGLHWAALQTVAWTTMLAANLSTSSFTEAVSDTFDGDHPCCLCKAIKAAKQSEKQSEAASVTLKMEFPLLAEKFLLVSPKAFESFAAEKFSAETFSSKPPLPPPRSLFV
jgi:hypothetical protein